MKLLLAAAMSLCALASHAQTTQSTSSTRPDPADPAVRTPPPVYESAFKDYQPFREDQRRAWREANDEVERLGGHQGHTDGARKPAPAAKPQPHKH